MRVLVTGATGMVGASVNAYCASIGDELFSYDHSALDISDADAVRRTLESDRPDVVINCAAWTDVDGCQLNQQRAYAANASGPENLANASREIKAGLITISTDYVFDGSKPGFYTQADKPRPQSIYGMAKLEGERLAQRAHPRTIVVRTGFVFGPGGRNFLSMIVARARRGETLRAIKDSYGTPTYSRNLAVRLRELAERDVPDVYHVVNAGEGASYEEFARKALDLAGLATTNLQSIVMDSLARPAPRPRNSRLKCLVSERLGLASLPSWSAALRDFVAHDVPMQADSTDRLSR